MEPVFPNFPDWNKEFYCIEMMRNHKRAHRVKYLEYRYLLQAVSWSLLAFLAPLMEGWAHSCWLDASGNSDSYPRAAPTVHLKAFTDECLAQPGQLSVGWPYLILTLMFMISGRFWSSYTQLCTQSEFKRKTGNATSSLASKLVFFTSL